MEQARIAVTHYCERTGGMFWGEPLNALTNLAFLVAAIILLRRLHREGKVTFPNWDIQLLILLIIATGIGSFLWHTLAVHWAHAADVIPILLFINAYILSALYRLAGLTHRLVIPLFLLYHLFNMGLQWTLPVDFLQGSIFYLPTLLTLYTLALYLYRQSHASALQLAAAALLFTLSLTLRTLDNALCPLWPWGTHFIWHLLNAIVLYLLVRALILSPGPLDKFHREPTT